MKTNIIKTFAVLMLVGVIALPAFVSAQVPAVEGGDVGGADSASITPSTDAGNIGGADSNVNLTAFVPATDGAATGGADSNSNPSGFVPATEGAGIGGGDVGSASNGGSNGSGPAAQISGGGSGGFSGGSRASTTLPLLSNVAKCSYISDYLKINGVNSSAEVSKLQTFLKNTEKLDVDINGNFDQKTFEAVKAFQTKYANDVLLPWGGKTATGQVYYTTKKKINEIYCKSTFSLTPEQLAQIEAYRNGSAAAQADANVSTIGSTTTNSLTPDVGSNTNESQTAAVAGTSFASKIWGFIKWLFGY